MLHTASYYFIVLFVLNVLNAVHWCCESRETEYTPHASEQEVDSGSLQQIKFVNSELETVMTRHIHCHGYIKLRSPVCRLYVVMVAGEQYCHQLIVDWSEQINNITI